MTRYIELVPDADLLASGIEKYVRWDYAKFPSCLIFGSTGSGKTYFLKILLGRIALHIPESEIVLADYKGDNDFDFARAFSNFYRFDQCTGALEKAISELHKRQQDISADRHFFALVFDEWSSFLNSLDKKSAESAKQNLVSLLQLGRSFNIHVIISQQRADAQYFATARDNFSLIVGLGRLSKESVEMMFSDYKEEIEPKKSQGYGTMLIGNRLKNVAVPKVHDIHKLNQIIITGLNRL